MTNSWLLNWGILALSLFNTILLVWLGLTVILNAERRNWGVWLIGVGLLAGAFFFISHTAIFGIGRNLLTLATIDFWWRAGWPALVLIPLTWYVAVLWYAGFWDAPFTSLHRRQRYWFGFTLLFAGGLVLTLLFTSSLPSFEQLADLDLTNSFNLAGIPFMLLAFPLFILLCTGLSLDVLARPGPSHRAVLGSHARIRARPWLIAASIDLLLVSLLVSGVMVWVVANAQGRVIGREADSGLIYQVALFDFLISGLISGAILIIGQAFAAYEIFTGAALPRRGLSRNWRRVILLATGYSLLIGGAFAIHLAPIYSLLLTALMMTTFFALLNWRSFAERERQVRLLRPFVSPEGLYEQLLTENPPENRNLPPFDELIQTVLYARKGYLIPVGARAALVEPYASPRAVGFDTKSANGHDGNTNSAHEEIPTLHDLIPHLTPDILFISIDRARYRGTAWAIPLWAGKTLVGVMLLGEKRDGGLYAQEEIELAQAAGERLLDTQASAELTRRLAALQRRELAETQIADRRTRRALHDDILPQLHTALLTLPPNHPAITQLTSLHQQISALLREMPPATTPEFARKGVFEGLRQVVEGELAGMLDEVVWEVPGEVEEHAQELPALEAEVLFYAAREVLRNAAHHSRGASPLVVRISAICGERLEVLIEDIGESEKRGAGEKVHGSGSGLALHGTMLAVVGGELETVTNTDGGIRVKLRM